MRERVGVFDSVTIDVLVVLARSEGIRGIFFINKAAWGGSSRCKFLPVVGFLPGSPLWLSVLLG